LRYAGRQVAARAGVEARAATGAGWSHNKIFDVDLPIRRDTRLGYRVFPAPRDSARNVYVQGVRCNGRALTSSSLPHSADFGRRSGTGAFGVDASGLGRRAGWTTLDRRSGDSFAWGRQTRAFSVGSAGTYGKYRLPLDGEAVLSEVELLV